jgi:hypothetical protein
MTTEGTPKGVPLRELSVGAERKADRATVAGVDRQRFRRDNRTHDAERHSRRRRGRAAFVVVAAAVIGLAVVAVATRSDDTPAARDRTTTTDATTPPTPGEPGLVATFSGSGNDTTDEFEVGPNWEVRWQASGPGPFSVELFTTTGQSRGRIVDRADRTEGATFIVESGRFTLQVSADGEWSIRVISLAGDE